jgi:hypothetical protein
MKTRIVAAAVGLFTMFAAAKEARAANYIIYLQGRGWQNWDSMQSANVSGWTNDYIAFDGNAPLNDSSTISAINSRITSHCQSGNTCVIQCYSAGCLRMQKAVSDLRAAGNSLSGLNWADATASAAGGTHLAELATGAGTGLIAKILGQQEKIDFDLTPAKARAFYTSDFGKTIYHVAGNQDICKGFWIFKICGNTYVDPGYAADGVVPMASAGGCTATNHVSDYGACAKYTYHVKENRVTNTPTTGDSYDHFGMANDGAKTTQVVLSGLSANTAGASWTSANGVTHTACTTSDYSCDDTFYQQAEDFSIRPSDQATVATDVNAYVSNTTYYTDQTYISGAWRNTCNGKCGGSNSYGGVTCKCDSGCTSRGDCCADYSTSWCTGQGYNSSDCSANTSQCDVVNAQ